MPYCAPAWTVGRHCAGVVVGLHDDQAGAEDHEEREQIAQPRDCERLRHALVSRVSRTNGSQAVHGMSHRRGQQAHVPSSSEERQGILNLCVADPAIQDRKPITVN